MLGITKMLLVFPAIVQGQPVYLTLGACARVTVVVLCVCVCVCVCVCLSVTALVATYLVYTLKAGYH